METFALSTRSQADINAYKKEHYLMRYEKEILSEINLCISNGDGGKLNWFAGFGPSLRHILMNVHAYRMCLKFGFTDFSIGKYGWLENPQFLDLENIPIEQSEVRLDCSPNGNWAYALRCNFGTAGSSGPLGVFCLTFIDRHTALRSALQDLKSEMRKYVGHLDSTNYKQDVITRTLSAIELQEVNLVQLTFF